MAGKRYFSKAIGIGNLGFTTVLCGPGAIAQALSTDEFVSTDQLVDATKMYLYTMVELLS